MFKLLNLLLLLLILNLNVFGQTGQLKSDAKKDSAWVAEGRAKPGKLFTEIDDANNKTIVTHPWIKGKVIYCADGSLRVRQLIADPDNLNTTIQYSYHNKLVEQQINYTDLANYSLNEIYRLPDKTPTYLFLLSKRTVNVNDYSRDWLKEFYSSIVQPADSDFENINYLVQVALVLRLEKDSLKEIPFPRDTIKDNESDTKTSDNDMAADITDSTYTITDTTNTDTASLSFSSYIKPGKFPKPYLKYDNLTHELSFLNTYSEHPDDNISPDPFISVSSGIYKYIDTTFVLTKDTSYNYPSLDQLDTVIAQKNYKAGKFIIKSKVIHGYEEGYGGYFHETLTTEYRIGKQQLSTFNNDFSDSRDTSTNPKPDYRLQKNSSLIMLLEDDTNGHGPGACGSGSHYDSHFWLVDNKSSKQLFSFSASTCTSLVNYTFTKNGKEVAQNFYLIHPTDDYDINYEFYSYWKNSSTYVFEISDSQKLLLRNFYLQFNAADKKNPVSLTAGKLQHKKSVAPN